MAPADKRVRPFGRNALSHPITGLWIMSNELIFATHLPGCEEYTPAVVSIVSDEAAQNQCVGLVVKKLTFASALAKRPRNQQKSGVILLPLYNSGTSLGGANPTAPIKKGASPCSRRFVHSLKPPNAEIGRPPMLYSVPYIPNCTVFPNASWRDEEER